MYYPDAQKKYNDKITTFTLKYSLKEKKEADRLLMYLQKENLTRVGYLKALIKADLDAKGIPYPELSDDSE